MIVLVAVRRFSRLVSASREWRGANIINRALRTSIRASGRIFPDLENQTMYNLVKSKPECQTTTVHMPEFPSVEDTEFAEVLAQDWSEESPERVADAFALASAYSRQSGHPITDQSLNNLCDAVKAKCEAMTDEQLLGVLRHLRLWPETDGINAQNFNLWKAADVACTARAAAWTREQALLASDHWFQLRLVRYSRFMTVCMRKLCRKPSKLAPAHLVQTLLYLNAQRRFDAVADMFELEHTLQGCADALSMEDLAVAGVAFFKSQTKIRSELLLARMAEAVGAGAATASDVHLSALLKTLRYSAPLSLADQLYAALGQLEPVVPRMSLLTCTHAALAGTNSQVLHEGLVEAAAARVARDAADARLKDLERMALALGLFGVAPRAQPCVFEALLRELRSPAREDEHRRHRKCLPRALYFLTLHRIFPLDLLERVMHPDYIHEAYGRNAHAYELELLALNVALEVECPSYNGPFLDPKVATIIAKRFRLTAPLAGAAERGSYADRALGQLLTAATEAAGGLQRAAARHLLPHASRADVVVRAEAAGACLPLGDAFLATPPDGRPRRAPADGALWLALVATSWNAYVHGDGGGRFVGSFQARLRQLAALGYRPVVVPWTEWTKIPTDSRPEYIRRLLRETAAAPTAGAL